MPVHYTVPGLSPETAQEIITTLQVRLSAYNDLHLTLKHVHWNVVGRNFIAVHEMLDPQVDLVRGYADEVAERIAALGGSPVGTPGAIMRDRTWDDYSIGIDTSLAHLGALDKVYEGVVGGNRTAFEKIESLDAVTHDMLVGQTGELEKFQWFVRAHLEDAEGRLSVAGTHTEKEAAAKAD